tara:strand:- start:29562 stop:30044 length:483 start_codon:yes stop_codon:yes gene_type:complete
MRKILLATLSLSLLLPLSAYAGGSHGGHGMAKMDHSKMNMAMNQSQNAAYQVLVKGIDMMEKTGSDKYIKEMLSMGPIMEEWHETTEGIYDAIDALETYAATLGIDKKKALESSIEEYNDVLDTFHMATHDAEAKDVQIAIGGKVQEARFILEKLKPLMH